MTNIMDKLMFKEFEENGFKVEGFYSDVTGTTIISEFLEIVIAVKKS